MTRKTQARFKLSEVKSDWRLYSSLWLAHSKIISAFHSTEKLFSPKRKLVTFLLINWSVNFKTKNNRDVSTHWPFKYIWNCLNRMYHSRKHTKAFDYYVSTSINLNLAWKNQKWISSKVFVLFINSFDLILLIYRLFCIKKI